MTPAFMGNTQIKVLALIANIVLITCVCFTCVAVKEEPTDGNNEDEYTPLSSPSKPTTTTTTTESNTRNSKKPAVLSSLLKSVRRLPRQIQLICFAQFFAWIGWFPFNFFSTEYIKDIWLAGEPEPWTQVQIREAVRAGSLALFLFSCVSIVAALILPNICVQSSSSCCGLSNYRLCSIWAASQLLFTALMFIIPSLPLENPIYVILLVACVGVCWAVSTWIPFALIGQFVALQNSRDASTEVFDVLPEFKRSHSIGAQSLKLEASSSSSDNTQQAAFKKRTRSFDSSGLMESSSYGTLMIDRFYPGARQQAHSAGIILGVHNSFIVLPQFFSTALSGLIFELCAGQPERQAIAWMWRVGGVCSIFSAFIAMLIGQ